MAKQWIDYKQGTDTGYENSDSIQPVADGEMANQTVFRRPSENLRQRTEIVRDAVEENLYLRDVDRALTVWGGGNVTWNGTSTVAGNGKFTITADLYVAPVTGVGDSGSTPEIASVFGTLTLQKTGPANGIVVTSKKRNYEGGDKISVEIILDNGIGGNTQITVAGSPANKIQIKVKNTTTLNHVITDVAANVTANALVGMALAGGAASGDIILAPQSEQYIQGNWDSELHVITAANLASFFTTPANVLEDGDALCIWYNNNIEGTVSADTSDPKGGVLGGRRESIVENANYTIPVGSLFNSRVNPERLPNSIPVCRAVEGGAKLKFIDGSTFVYGTSASPLGGTGYALKTDLAATTAGKGASTIGIEDSGAVFTATTVEGALAELDSDITTLSGNVTSGLALKVAKAGDTMTGNLLPSATGLDLGSGSAFWDAYLNTVTLNGNMNPVTEGGASIGNTNRLDLLAARRVEINNQTGSVGNNLVFLYGKDNATTRQIDFTAGTGLERAMARFRSGLINKSYINYAGIYTSEGTTFHDGLDYNTAAAFTDRYTTSVAGTGTVPKAGSPVDSYVDLSTGGASGGIAQCFAQTLNSQAGDNPYFRVILTTPSSITNCVLRAGIQNLVYFEYDDTNPLAPDWTIRRSGVADGNGIDTNVTVYASTSYILSFYIQSSTTLLWSIGENTSEDQNTSVLTSSLTYGASNGAPYCYVANSTNADRTLRIHDILYQTNRIVSL